MLGAVGYSGFDHNNWMDSMNWEVISTASEFVGAVAVVASVIYLATQIKRQTTESKLVATRDLSVDLHPNLIQFKRIFAGQPDPL